MQAKLPDGRCDAWEVASEGLLQYLDACLDPRRSRVLLVDGPRVLGLFELVQMADTSRAAVLPIAGFTLVVTSRSMRRYGGHLPTERSTGHDPDGLGQRWW